MAGNDTNNKSTNGDTNNQGEDDDEQKATCDQCTKPVPKGAPRCSMCKSIFHPRCCDLTAVIVKQLSKNKQSHWYCGKCNPLAEDLVASIAEMRTKLLKIDSLEEQLVWVYSTLKNVEDKVQKIDQMEDGMRKMGDKVEQIEQIEKEKKEVEEKANTTDQVISASYREQDFPTMKDTWGIHDPNVGATVQAKRLVRQQMESVRQEDERRPNVMVYNLPEAKSNIKEEVRLSDTNYFVDITKICGVAFTSKDVKEVIRLGKKPEQGNAPRPLLVKLADVEKKKDIFKKLHIFREHQAKDRSTDDTSPFVSVSHDLTQEQREERRELIEEAKKKDQDLEHESPYRHVVWGPPWDMKVMKVKRRT